MSEMQIFPGFKHKGVVADQVKEIAITFNTESLGALSTSSPASVGWAEIGTRVTPGHFEVKIPIRLPSQMAFEPFEGVRSYGKLDIAAPAVTVGPFALNYEWDMYRDQDGNVLLKEFYGVSGLGADIVKAARSHKARMLAELLKVSFTNAALGVSAKAHTIPQPGYPNGLPLFVDGTGDNKHYAHPFKASSRRFHNLHLGAGKITDEGVFSKVLRDARMVPHPSLPDEPLGLRVTDLVGPTHMEDYFYAIAQQRLNLEINSAASAFGATTNRHSIEALKAAYDSGMFLGASGLGPYRFWVAPQLDQHPYVQANPDKHMWMSIAAADPSQRWAEFAAPTREFVPITTLFGDQDPQSQRSRKVSLIGDLDAGVAPGLPHFAHMYFETTPS